jgi:4-diphosphocytidyl-2-C-methyl-D-erythritol kinase
MVKPPINVSTAAVYSAIDSAEITERPDTEAVISAIQSGDVSAVARGLSNVMGTVTENMHPIVRGIRTKMMMNGALGAVMSGSGPTVFGIFPDFATAKKAHDSFAYQFREVFLVQTI